MSRARGVVTPESSENVIDIRVVRSITTRSPEAPRPDGSDYGGVYLSRQTASLAARRRLRSRQAPGLDGRRGGFGQHALSTRRGERPVLPQDRRGEERDRG